MARLKIKGLPSVTRYHVDKVKKLKKQNPNETQKLKIQIKKLIDTVATSNYIKDNEIKQLNDRVILSTNEIKELKEQIERLRDLGIKDNEIIQLNDRVISSNERIEKLEKSLIRSRIKEIIKEKEAIRAKESDNYAKYIKKTADFAKIHFGNFINTMDMIRWIFLIHEIRSMGEKNSKEIDNSIFISRKIELFIIPVSILANYVTRMAYAHAPTLIMADWFKNIVNKIKGSSYTSLSSKYSMYNNDTYFGSILTMWKAEELKKDLFFMEDIKNEIKDALLKDNIDVDNDYILNIINDILENEFKERLLKIISKDASQDIREDVALDVEESVASENEEHILQPSYVELASFLSIDDRNEHQEIKELDRENSRTPLRDPSEEWSASIEGGPTPNRSNVIQWTSGVSQERVFHGASHVYSNPSFSRDNLTHDIENVISL